MRILMSAAFALHAVAGAQAQSVGAIPATAPTQTVSSLPSAQPAVSATQGGHGSVSWNGSVLTVTGAGDSLRNILRQIARSTGMKVTGGVPDEQVFGVYGPGSVQKVLASLFNGLSVNMMLINGSPTQPKELVLTARTGGATPPSPTQSLTMSDDPADVNLAQPRPGRHSSPDSFGQPPIQEQPGTSNAGPGVSLPGITVSPSGTDANANGQLQPPDSVRTPEQIFEELRKRQQGQATPK